MVVVVEVEAELCHLFILDHPREITFFGLAYLSSKTMKNQKRLASNALSKYLLSGHVFKNDNVHFKV